MIVFDSASNSGALASTTANSVAHTIGTSKGDRLLVVVVQGNDSTADRIVSGVTYNSVAMTKAVEKNAGSYNVTIWYLVNPSTGTNNVTVTWGGSVNFACFSAASFFNVLQATPTDNTGNNTDTGNPSTSITTSYNGSVIVDGVYSELGSNLTVGADQNLIAQIGVNGGGDRAVSSYKITSGSGAQTMNWTGSALYVSAAAGFRAVPEGGAFLLNIL